MNENLQKLYDNLTQAGYELPDFNTFSKDMQDTTKAQRLYSTMTSDGYELPNSFDSFYQDIAPKRQSDAVEPEGGFFENTGIPSLAKSAWNVIGNQVPSAIAAYSQRSAREAESTLTGDSWYTKLRNALGVPVQNEERQRLGAVVEGAEQSIEQNQGESQELLKDIPQSYKDVGTASDFVKYIGGLAGQAVGQIPLSVGTAGASSYLQESQAVYRGQLERIAKEKGISVRDVIEQGLDEPAAGQAFAVAATGLDLLSNLTVVGKVGKGPFSSWLRKTLFEAATEPTQGVLEDIGAGYGVQESVVNSKRIDEAIGGFVGGGLMSADVRIKNNIKAKETQINETVDQVADTGDPQLNAEIDAAAEIDPIDKQVLEESVVANAIQQEQKEIEKAEKLEEDLGNKVPNAENKSENSGESAENGQDTAELKPTQTPEYKQAVAKVEDLQKKFAELPIDENADELLFELREARKALQQIAGKPKDTLPKTDIQKQIEDTTGVTKPEKSIKMTPNEAIKQQVQTFYKGVREGVYRGKDASNELVNKVQEAIKESPLTPKQVSSILGRVKRTNLFTPGSVSRLNDFIDKVSNDAEYADKLSEARSINSKLRKLSKTKNKNLQNVKGLAKAFASINPEDTFINPHLDWGRKILSSLSSPTGNNYQVVDVASAEEYVTDLQNKIAEYETEEVEKAQSDGSKSAEKLKATLGQSLEALGSKDLSEFDDSEVRMIDTIKGLNPEELSNEQMISAIRVIDNIVENDDLSNAAAIEPIVKSKAVLKSLTEKYKDTEKAAIRDIGKVGANTYQQFTRIFGDSGIASDVQQATGILDVFNAGSRVENQEIKLTKELKEKIQQINKKYKIKVQDIENQVRLTIYSELAKNYGDDSHIPKVKTNIERTIAELEKTDPDEAQVWKDVWKEFSNVEKVEDATLPDGLMEVWKFFNSKFSQDINPRLEKITNELYNKPYIEANNYAHTSIRQLTDTSIDKEQYAEKSGSGRGKIKPKQSKTSVTATRNMPQGYGYSSDFIESQLRGYRESLYDIEASRANALVRETIYSPEFEELVGGRDNAKIVRSMIKRAEEIQRGMSRATANDAVKSINTITQFFRNIGAIRALASLSQPFKQVPSVWTKAFFNHVGTGSLPEFFKAIGSVNLLSTSPNIKKLLDLYTIGVRGERLGGIERGDAVTYRLSPTGRGIQRSTEYLQGLSDKFGRIVLKPLTNSDVYAARTTWLGYYLQSLKEQGITKVDLNSEYLKQEDPKRKSAAAFAEQMLAETQVPSNPATLAQIVRNENDGGWNFAKNILIPFSTFSLTAKYRNVSDVSKFIRNPSAKNAGAVAGDVFEIATFAGIAYGLLPFYKDWLKSGIESLFDLEAPEEDEEKKAQKKQRAFWTNVTNSAFPFAIGTIGEYGVSKTANALAWMMQNPEGSFEDWKKETGGFVYEPEEFDMGVYTLGLEPYKELATSTIDLATGEGTKESFGQSSEVELTEEQKNLLALKVMFELGGIMGIQEADIYNQVRKVYREQLRQPQSTPRRDNPRPRPRPRLRPKPN